MFVSIFLMYNLSMINGVEYDFLKVVTIVCYSLIDLLLIF